jgi:hypothetical protein
MTENKPKDYEILIITKYKNFLFVNVNQEIDTTKALGMLAKASHHIASANKIKIDPKYATFPVFITVDEGKAREIVGMTDEEWNAFLEEDKT